MINFFDLSLLIKGFPMKEATAEFEKICSVPDSEFESFNNQRKTDIVEYHIKNNKSYREFVAGSSLENKDVQNLNWNQLPVMTKKDFQRPLAERLSTGYNPKNIYLNKTSGSSGDPFIFAKDKYSHALTWHHVYSRFAAIGLDFRTALEARFYGIPLDFLGKRKERLKDFLSKRYRFPIFDMSDNFLENTLTKFKSKKFEYINGYTSSIVLFAKFLKTKNIRLNEICPSLKCCIVTAEMLFEEDKILMEKQFGVPVINEYGASELGLIAFENAKGEWQVNAETIFVEILDQNNIPVPNGTEGRVVITSLYNKAHPFIRYDIGDIGALDEKSTFKKPILKKLIGRTNDIAILPSGKKSPGLTFYYVTKSIIEDDGNVKEFVIKQNKPDTFEIDYVSEIELNREQIQNIHKAIEIYLEPGLKFTFSRKSSLERSARGKLKQFSSQL